MFNLDSKEAVLLGTSQLLGEETYSSNTPWGRGPGNLPSLIPFEYSQRAGLRSLDLPTCGIWAGKD